LAALWCSASAARKRGRTQRHLAGVPLYRAEASQALAGEFMVSFGPKATNAMLEDFCAQNGPCTQMGHPDDGGVSFVVVKSSEAGLESSIAASNFKIAYVEQDAVAEDFEEASSEEEEETSLSETPWGLIAIGAPKSRSKGKGVNVYVLDSGVRVTHSDFGGRAVPLYDATKPVGSRVCRGTDTQCAKDERGHGTHVAGSVGGENYGVAPAATIFAMQRGRSLSDGFSSMDWLVQNRKIPAVLQMSWGTGYKSTVAEEAVNAAVSAGITVTVASGNSNSDACAWTFAGYKQAIAVASTDSGMRRSSFSNYGPCIDIMAPGSSIKSADYRSDTRTAVMSGTSMAAPHVAGAAALILESDPEMSPAQVLQRLVANAKKGAISDPRTDNDNFLQVG